MDEYEKLESELKQVYEEYVIKYRYPPSNLVSYYLRLTLSFA